MTQGRGNVIDFDDIFGMALQNSNPQNANGKASGTSIKNSCSNLKQLYAESQILQGQKRKKTSRKAFPRY